MSFGLYAAGYRNRNIGLVYAAHLMRISPTPSCRRIVMVSAITAVSPPPPKDPPENRDEPLQHSFPWDGSCCPTLRQKKSQDGARNSGVQQIIEPQ